MSITIEVGYVSQSTEILLTIMDKGTCGLCLIFTATEFSLLGVLCISGNI